MRPSSFDGRAAGHGFIFVVTYLHALALGSLAFGVSRRSADLACSTSQLSLSWRRDDSGNAPPRKNHFSSLCSNIVSVRTACISTQRGAADADERTTDSRKIPEGALR